MKIYQTMCNATLFNTLHKFGMFLFDDHRVPKNSDIHHIICDARRYQVSLIIKHVLALIIGVAIFMLHPAYLFLRGGRPYIFAIELIGVPDDAPYTYWVTMAFQLYVSVTGLMGFVGMDVFLLEVISVFALGNDLVAHNTRLLSTMCNKAHNGKSRIEQKLFLRNIILQIQDNDE